MVFTFISRIWIYWRPFEDGERLMSKIYLPIENFNEYACYSIYDKDTIRAYKTMPYPNSSSEYKDFFINSHYLERDGFQQWGNYNSYLPVCLNKDYLTNAYMYRYDIMDILVVFTLIILIVYIPFSILFKRFFRGMKVY